MTFKVGDRVRTIGLLKVWAGSGVGVVTELAAYPASIDQLQVRAQFDTGNGPFATWFKTEELVLVEDGLDIIFKVMP